MQHSLLVRCKTSVRNRILLVNTSTSSSPATTTTATATATAATAAVSTSSTLPTGITSAAATSRSESDSHTGMAVFGNVASNTTFSIVRDMSTKTSARGTTKTTRTTATHATNTVSSRGGRRVQPERLRSFYGRFYSTMAGAVERVEEKAEEGRQVHQQQQQQLQQHQLGGDAGVETVVGRGSIGPAQARAPDGTVLITRIRRVEPASARPMIAFGSPCGLVRRILRTFPNPDWIENEGEGEKPSSTEPEETEPAPEPVEEHNIPRWGPEDHMVYEGTVQYDRSPDNCSNPRVLSKAEKLQVEMMWQCFERVQAHHGLYTENGFPWDTFPEEWVFRETPAGDPKSELNKSLNKLLGVRPLASNITSKICYNLLISPNPPDLATYNILLLGFTRIRKSALSYAVLQFMENIQVAPDPYTIAALLNMYVKSNDYRSFRRLSENLRYKLSRRSGSLWTYSEELKWYVKDTWYWIFDSIVIGYLQFGKPKHAVRTAYILAKTCAWRPTLEVQTSFLRYHVEQQDGVRGKAVWREIKKLEPDERAYHWILRLCRVCNLAEDLAIATAEARALGFDPAVLVQNSQPPKIKGLNVSRKNKAPDLKSMPKSGWGLPRTERMEEKYFVAGRRKLERFTTQYDAKMGLWHRPLLERERRAAKDRVVLSACADKVGA